MTVSVVLLTGAQAAGKSTAGRALAARAQRGVFLDGDTLRLDTVRLFTGWVRATPVSLQHDSSEETPAETAAALHDRLIGMG